MHELHTNLEFDKYIQAQTTAADTDITGTAIDTQGVKALELGLHIGPGGTVNASNKVDVKLEKAPDNNGVPGTYVPIVALDLVKDDYSPDANGLIVTVDNATEDDIFKKIGIHVNNPDYRFFRAVLDITGNPAFPVAMEVVKLPYEVPV
ncbi:MAG: hypothetical protein ABIK28_03535 [Planctomycetota bacterium]